MPKYEVEIRALSRFKRHETLKLIERCRDHLDGIINRGHGNDLTYALYRDLEAYLQMEQE